MLQLRFVCLSLVWLLFSISADAQQSASVSKKKLRSILDSSIEQYLHLQEITPSGKLPSNFTNGRLNTQNPSGWVSGFFPGTLWELYRYSKDSRLKAAAEQRMALLNQEQFNTHTHDLGFMMYCSYGTARKIDPSLIEDSVLINSARSLMTRFNPIVGSIRSWDSDSTHFLVIIDNMMNLELLMFAFRQTGDSSFYKVAVTHANTTIKNHFRPDYSSYHVLDYNPRTGAIQAKRTHQGAADSSAWARGQSWGLYGFTMMYRETADPKYLEQANHIADFILHNPTMPSDLVPYWDYDAPGIPNAYRDASAAAILASALLELRLYVKGSLKKEYTAAAEKIIRSLSNKPYKTTGNERGGFILDHSVGHLPGKSEIDVPLSYADYYYIESILRCLGLLEPSPLHRP